MINRNRLTIPIALFALLMGIGCSDERTERIPIGVIAPLTGDNAVYGSSLRRGIELAANPQNNEVDSINSIRFIYEDSQADPNRGVSAFRKLTSVDNVPAVIGAMFSAVSRAIAPIAQRNQILLLSPTSSEVGLTSLGSYIYRIYPSDRHDGRFLADVVTDTLNRDRAAILHIDVASVNDIVDVFKARFRSNNGTIVAELGYSQGTTTFTSQLARVEQSDADVLFLPGYLREMSIQLREAEQIGLNIPIVTISTFYDPQILKLAGDAANGVIFSTPAFDPSDSTELVTNFVDAYQAKYGTKPDTWAAFGYDAARLMNHAVSIADSLGEVTPNTTRQQLKAVKNFPGITGQTTFDSIGNADKPLRLMTVRQGEFLQYSDGIEE